MLVTRFEDLEVWKHSRILVHEIYCITSVGLFSKDFELKNQIRRASSSILLNISEGFDSRSQKSFFNFLTYSFRSVSESRAILYISLDLKYISPDQFNDLTSKLIVIQKMLTNLMKYLKRKEKQS